MKLKPISITDARIFVARHHRHNRPPVGGLFAVAVESEEEIVGVAIVGRPIARMLQDGYTCEVTRTCTNGQKNANSMLYGACARAAKALGYHRIITYTLESELGTSLKASGWKRDARVHNEESWASKGRMRYNRDLLGHQIRPLEDKMRWVREFNP